MSPRDEMTFWEHLEELRRVFIKITVAIIGCGLVAFLLKDEVFRLILAPHAPDFLSYRLCEQLHLLSQNEITTTASAIQLVNTTLTGQFAMHVKASAYVGFMVASPYVFYQLFGYIAPAFEPATQQRVVPIVVSSFVMFCIGLAFNYFVIFPLTFHFLGTYQVSGSVENLITLNSYVDTLLVLSLLMGILFELPLVCWLMGRCGLLTASTMRRYRRHAVVAIVVVSAIITPTSDVFTLMVVSLPIWLLYEVSVLLVPK
jgi:twin arginine-targeting protein translocase tatC